ncbi:FliH/SctL family protein [Variovorax ginsengisoli]|uniref:Flagellar assembly protein FliH n=1 Tax=Variovorax ginsengisoli TaxID=363844 RepID=A0ABT8SFR9_9BURK|nr:FliH/SctL family protein [Variovorax ginsengisoli]MDN8618014.1 FliH/SctL family protein [Variovorax ginsengisoli]MDO1537184.1 FliH/SctL family protein [Variovorax ginsengisoli]
MNPVAGAGLTGLPTPAGSPAAQIAEEARQRGYEEGYAEGRARGAEEAQRIASLAAEQADRDLRATAERLTRELNEQAQAAYQARVRSLEALIAALPPQIEARLAEAEDDTLGLAFEVVCRVLGEEAVRPDRLRSQFARAIEGLRNRQLVAVHLHPEDLAALERNGGLSDLCAGAPGIRWVASSAVVLGGCILESPEGGLDARFETQLQALRDLLQDSRARLRAGQGESPAMEPRG